MVIWEHSIERFSFECRKEIGFVFATLHDWLKKFAPIFHPIRSKTKTNRDSRARDGFPAFCVSYLSLLRVLIGSLYCVCSLWLASLRAITLVLVLRHSTENHSKCRKHSPVARVFYFPRVLKWPSCFITV